MRAFEFVNEISLGPIANTLKNVVKPAAKRVEPIDQTLRTRVNYPNIPNPATSVNISPQARSAMSDLASGHGSGQELKSTDTYQRDIRSLNKEKFRDKQRQTQTELERQKGQRRYDDDDAHDWQDANENLYNMKHPELGSEYHQLNAIVEFPDENFADGKNPGRKGLAKRSGVNTKASVSSLRKTAKHSTGEKARMAHWLANMKAGRAKKK